jgi:hypothetical protein
VLVRHIVSNTPVLVAVLQSVVLTGTGMSATAAENTVMLGATPCQRLIVTKLSTTSPGTATQVSCGVPADTVAGMRKVRSPAQSAAAGPA